MKRMSVATIAVLAVGLFGAAPASAACTGFISTTTGLTLLRWQGGAATLGAAIGNTQAMELRDHTNGACSSTAGTWKTGSAAMMYSGTGNFVEFGWKDVVPSSGSFVWEPYIRNTTSGSQFEQDYSQPTAACGTLVPPDRPRFRLYRDSGTWFFRMACPGSTSYTIVYRSAGVVVPSMSSGGQDAQVVLYRAGGTGTIADERAALSWRKLVDSTWSLNFGTMTCFFDNMSNTDGDAIGASATGWLTITGSAGC